MRKDIGRRVIRAVRDMLRKKRKQGYSLLETMIGLAVLSIILVAALYMYPKLKSSSNINNEMVNMNTIVTGINSIYNGNSNYSGLNNKVLIQAKIVPTSITADQTGKLINSWRGDIIIKSEASSGNGTLINITYTDVPRDQCIKFVTAVEKMFNVIRTDTLFSENKGTTTNIIKDTYTNQAFSINTSADACGKDLNKITFLSNGSISGL